MRGAAIGRVIAWALAAAALIAGWRIGGWPGVAFAVAVIVFWLLLDFTRSVRLLDTAGRAPLGHVDSAVMLDSCLRAGMTLAQVVRLAGSLGRRIGEAPEVWQWRDAGGASLEVTFSNTRCVRWSLQREAGAGAAG